jgi:hypothetical protein
VRLLAEAPCEQVIDMLGDIAPAAVADPDERWKLTHLLARSCVRADERAEQFKGTLSLFLAEPSDKQLQPLPRCHTSSLTADATTCRACHSHRPAGGVGSSFGPCDLSWAIPVRKSVGTADGVEDDGVIRPTHRPIFLRGVSGT